MKQPVFPAIELVRQGFFQKKKNSQVSAKLKNQVNVEVARVYLSWRSYLTLGSAIVEFSFCVLFFSLSFFFHLFAIYCFAYCERCVVCISFSLVCQGKRKGENLTPPVQETTSCGDAFIRYSDSWITFFFFFSGRQGPWIKGIFFLHPAHFFYT